MNLSTPKNFPQAVCRVAICALLFAPAGSANAADGWRPTPLDRAEEMSEALAAAPDSIRDGAGVYVLTSSGYELARESKNGFHCLIERSQKDAFEPQCFDAEGSATLLAQALMRAELRMSGASAEEVAGQVAAAWAAGQLRSPSRPGINYMMSPRNRVPVGPDRVIPYGPHVMFYVPYLTNEDVGGDPRGSSPVFVVNEGKPGAYVIVPVGEHEGH